MELSDEQKAAVCHVHTPALVVAGAGSGKTRTLTAKIDFLIGKGFDPERILAITFTNKAADEMKSRLEELTGMPYFRFPWVRTYHSACLRILKKHCHLLGFELPLQIYAPYHQQKLIKEILLSMNREKQHAPMVISHISRAKNSGNPLKYFETRARVSGIRLRDVFELYEKELKLRNAVDFDNILLLTRDILRDHKEVRKFYQDFFQYILVDEYQDTNNLQEELTGFLVKNGNLFCVGDDWQAIYGFRGSNVNNFLSFSDKYKNATIFRLEQNYRSADEIVKLANELIEYNQKKMTKTCFSKKRGGVVEIHEFFDESQEALWVCKKIVALLQLGLKTSDIGVLYRTKFCSLAFEKIFRLNNIPYKMMGAKGFFERKEILDINSYLISAIFPKDDVSFERILNTPKRGIGPAMLKRINAARTGDMSIQEAARKIVSQRVMTPKVHKALKNLITLLDEIKNMPPEEAVKAILSECSYMDYLRRYAKAGSMDFTSRAENIKQLIYTASFHSSLEDYLEEAAIINEDREDDGEKDDKGVRLSTIHASKGLEYPAVFIVGCEENLFPHFKSIDTQAKLQEERRLMYVAMTRAEKYLYLTWADFRRNQYNERSRFLDEIEEAK